MPEPSAYEAARTCPVGPCQTRIAGTMFSCGACWRVLHPELRYKLSDLFGRHLRNELSEYDLQIASEQVAAAFGVPIKVAAGPAVRAIKCPACGRGCTIASSAKDGRELFADEDEAGDHVIIGGALLPAADRGPPYTRFFKHSCRRQ